MALNLPPGTPNNTNLSYVSTWLFTPSTSATNNVRLVNNGRNTVYVGQAGVTVNSGIPIAPGSKPVELTGVLTPLYAVSQVSLGSVAGTITTTSMTAGSSVITMATVNSTAVTVGQLLAIQSTQYTSNLEVLSVAATTGTGSVTLSTTSLFAHDTTNVVYNVAATYGQLSVIGGVV